MPDLLLELFCEEIPARMQAQAADDLRRLVTDALIARGLTFEGAGAFATPRRLALHVAELPAAQPDTREERKGPKVGAPEAAVAGFLKGAGLASLNEASVRADPKKGDFYVAVIERRGRPTIDVLAELLPGVVEGFPWPKSMRWGAASIASNSLRWVRPLHAILATFGPDTEEPEVVPFAVGGIAAGNTTRGHRFMAPEPFTVRRFDDYVPALERAKVVLDPARRRDIILYDARTLALAGGYDLVEDEGLLHEVAGLVEWPVVLMGAFDDAFLDIPPEVIRATIRANQKCFVLRDATTGELAPRFILVANIEATDGGAAIAAGNAKVVRARLADARFFWEGDLKVPLDDQVPRLDAIVYHAKLGTQGERVRRLMALAAGLAPIVGADPVQAMRAAQLCKADLVTGMVGEFPELQGVMGRYYAAHGGETPAVAAACEDHYRPQGPADHVPTDPVAIAVALADKLDALLRFWIVDERPTGSKDPYALRRAAYGIIRIVVQNSIRLNFQEFLYQYARENIASVQYQKISETKDVRIERGIQLTGKTPKESYFSVKEAIDLDLVDFREKATEIMSASAADRDRYSATFVSEMMVFLAERLKTYLRETKARHDLIDAVFGSAGSDDFTLVVRRVAILGGFLASDEGANLLAGYRRAANILKAEAKKAPAEASSYADAFEPEALVEPAERALAARLAAARPAASEAVAGEDYEAAMRVLSTLREPVDTFFDAVTVNAPDPATRLNRLRLLNGFREAVHAVADFARVGG